MVSAFKRDEFMSQVGFAFPGEHDFPSPLDVSHKACIAAQVLSSPLFLNDREVSKALRKMIKYPKSIYYAINTMGGYDTILGLPTNTVDGREIAALSLLMLEDNESVENVLDLAFNNYISYQEDSRIPYIEAIYEKFPKEAISAIKSLAAFDNDTRDWGNKLSGAGIVDAAAIIGSEDGVPVLATLLKNISFGDSGMDEAIKQLESFSTPEAAEVLKHVSENHTKGKIKRKAKRALKKLS